jgi:hypothetical protein
MENIQYKIKEVENNDNIDKSMENEILSIVNNQLKNIHIVDKDNEFDKILSLQMYYEENYNKNHLIRISQYYNISTRKKKKIDLIQDIVLFENDPTNYDIVSKRKLMWYYISELKEDRFFKKFIIFQ